MAINDEVTKICDDLAKIENAVIEGQSDDLPINLAKRLRDVNALIGKMEKRVLDLEVKVVQIAKAHAAAASLPADLDKAKPLSITAWVWLAILLVALICIVVI